jgi:hypothetical protein
MQVPPLISDRFKEDPDWFAHGSHEGRLYGTQPRKRLPPHLLWQHANLVLAQYVVKPATQLQESGKCPLALEFSEFGFRINPLPRFREPMGFDRRLREEPSSKVSMSLRAITARRSEQRDRDGPAGSAIPRGRFHEPLILSIVFLGKFVETLYLGFVSERFPFRADKEQVIRSRAFLVVWEIFFGIGMLEPEWLAIWLTFMHHACALDPARHPQSVRPPACRQCAPGRDTIQMLPVSSVSAMAIRPAAADQPFWQQSP